MVLDVIAQRSEAAERAAVPTVDGVGPMPKPHPQRPSVRSGAGGRSVAPRPSRLTVTVIGAPWLAPIAAAMLPTSTLRPSTAVITSPERRPAAAAGVFAK